jgi:plastocyanin
MKKLFSTLAVLAVLGAAAVVAVPAMAGAAKTVKVLDFKFTPKTLTVKKGTKINWQWGGKIIHNVTLTKGPKGARKFASKTQTKGTFSQTLTTPGTYQIVCTIHVSQGMVMTITVKK